LVVGQKVAQTLYFGDCKGRTYSGRVVYIHPRRQFFVVEFQFGRGAFRESFYFPERGGNK